MKNTRNKLNKKYTILILLSIIILLLSTISKLNLSNNYQLNNTKGEDIKEHNLKFVENKKDIDAALNNNKATILTYGSNACPPCEELKINLKALSNEYKEQLNFIYIEVTETPELIKLYDIKMTPSVLIFDKEGKPANINSLQKIKYNLDIYKHEDNNGIQYVSTTYIPNFNDLENIIEIIK